MEKAKIFAGDAQGAAPGERLAGDAVPRDPIKAGRLVSGAAYIDGPGAVPSPEVDGLTPAELAVLRGEHRTPGSSLADAIIRTTLGTHP